jgi:hypothetical protein
MTTLIHIAAINIDNIIPVIIVFGVIISKIIKAVSGTTQGKPGRTIQSDEKEPAYNAAPSELRNFLETLTGVQLETEKPPPAPIPPQLPPKQQIRTKQFTQPPKRIKKTAPPAVTTPVTQITAEKKYHPHTKSANFKWNFGDEDKNKLITPIEVANDLISRKNLAKAIILKEILGPPVALK